MTVGAALSSLLPASQHLPGDFLVKALVYRGPKDVRVEKVPDTRIEQDTDRLVRSHQQTSAVLTCICMKVARQSKKARFSVTKT